MSLVFSSTSSAEGLEQLNNYFVGNTYVFGVALSAADAALFDAAGGKAPDASKYPHFARYINHIASYSAEERAAAPATKGLSVTVGGSVSAGAAAGAAAGGGKKAKKDDDDDMALDFGSDDDDDEEEDLAAKAKAAAEAKKKAAADAKKHSAKREPIAKSRIVFEVKPYDIETDLHALAAKIKSMKLEGELWDEKLAECPDDRCNLEEGCRWSEGHELVPIAFGVNKLIIQTIVHDDLVGADDLIETMMNLFEDDIQSIDIASFDKAS